MPTSDDLLGYGMGPFLAGLLGNPVQSINGAGTTQITATAINTHMAEVTGAGSATGVILPSAAKIGTPYYVASIGATAAKIWPPVGHTLNGSLNTGVTMSAQYATGIFIRMGGNRWYSIPLAP